MGIWSLPRWFLSLLYTLPSIVCFESCVLSGQCGKLPVQLCWREHFSALRALFSPRCRINGIPLQSWEVASASYLTMFVLLDGDVFRRNTRQYLESSKYNANSSWKCPLPTPFGSAATWRFIGDALREWAGWKCHASELVFLWTWSVHSLHVGAVWNGRSPLQVLLFHVCIIVMTFSVFQRWSSTGFDQEYLILISHLVYIILLNLNIVYWLNLFHYLWNLNLIYDTLSVDTLRRNVKWL